MLINLSDVLSDQHKAVEGVRGMIQQVRHLVKVEEI